MCQYSLKTNVGMSMGPGDVGLQLRSADSTSRMLICGACEGETSKVGGAGLSVGSARRLRSASSLLRVAPSTGSEDSVFLLSLR